MKSTPKALTIAGSDSALFYSDRKAILISEDPELIEFLCSNPAALLTLQKRHLERVESLKRISYVIDSAGNDVLVAPSK